MALKQHILQLETEADKRPFQDTARHILQHIPQYSFI